VQQRIRLSFSLSPTLASLFLLLSSLRHIFLFVVIAARS
jgi:hypothetical protein